MYRNSPVWFTIKAVAKSWAILRSAILKILVIMISLYSHKFRQNPSGYWLFRQSCHPLLPWLVENAFTLHNLCKKIGYKTKLFYKNLLPPNFFRQVCNIKPIHTLMKSTLPNSIVGLWVFVSTVKLWMQHKFTYAEYLPSLLVYCTIRTSHWKGKDICQVKLVTI